MKLLVIQPVFHDGARRKIGEVLELDCSYTTMPRWAVEYDEHALPAPGGAPDRRAMLERASRRAPPKEPLQVEKDYVDK